MTTVETTIVEGEGVPPASPRAARRRARPVVDRLEANTRRIFGMRVVAVLALWLLRRMPVMAFPIRLARLLIGAFPVFLWFLRRADRRRAVAPRAPALSVQSSDGTLEDHVDR